MFIASTHIKKPSITKRKRNNFKNGQKIIDDFNLNKCFLSNKVIQLANSVKIIYFLTKKIYVTKNIFTACKKHQKRKIVSRSLPILSYKDLAVIDLIEYIEKVQILSAVFF
jgi:hypothetical protein